ncbi:unnamed protein product [marine sediment metagenome]|uniref:Uncharacterized protein n=1 Tax=marine sediment metagenome TaxID=412755 RepID=X1SPP1_9ZZZZ
MKVFVVKRRPAGLALSIQSVNGGTDFLVLSCGGDGKVAISENHADNTLAIFGDAPDPFHCRFQLRGEELALQHGLAFRNELEPLWWGALNQVDDDRCRLAEVHSDLVFTGDSNK